MSRGHVKNKILGVWLSEKDYQKLEQFLDKFSTGDSFSDQLRSFIHSPVNQTEGIDQTRLTCASGPRFAKRNLLFTELHLTKTHKKTLPPLATSGWCQIAKTAPQVIRPVHQNPRMVRRLEHYLD